MSAKIHRLPNRPAAVRHVEPAEFSQVPHARLNSAERIMIAGLTLGFLTGMFWRAVFDWVMR